MKNIILCTLLKIKQTPYCANGLKLYNKYEQIKEISEKSLKNHYKNCEFHVIKSKQIFENHNLAFYYVFKKTYEIWKQNTPCNILFYDIDSVCLNYHTFFKYKDHFILFSEAPALNIYKDKIYRSCCLRYFPYNMNPKLWDIGMQQWKDKINNTTKWDVDQVIYNNMFYSPLNKILDNNKYLSDDINYSDVKEFNHKKQDINKCCIVHIPASRGIDNCI